ncbi:MAG: MFS transporter, partial [Muribaculaceae bacterium]|nr:MFS transporter [Muribaculaceae bacterium]
GIRSTFYRLSSIFGQGVLVYIAGYLARHGLASFGIEPGNIPLSWRMTLGFTALIFTLVTLYHSFIVPRPANDRPNISKDSKGGAGAIFKEFANSFATYFKKKGLWLAIAFMLLYRLPEAFLIKMCTPFLVASREVGGLGLSTENVGIVYGTIGVFFLTIGGILGGIFASKVGLKKSLWIMAACMTLPCLTFCYLAECQPENLAYISIAVAIEQFGYGFGFTAYMLYMMYFSEGPFTTSHYAICTAFMAMSMMLPGMVAGFIQEALGYSMFFWMVIICCIATLIVTYFADRKIDPTYGLK